MDRPRILEFELCGTSTRPAVRVRLRDVVGRWAAVVESASTASTGVGGTAREALVAALAPFGSRALASVMADPVMFGASAQLHASDAG